jgi:hypothetical protein
MLKLLSLKIYAAPASFSSKKAHGVAKLGEAGLAI